MVHYSVLDGLSHTELLHNFLMYDLYFSRHWDCTLMTMPGSTVEV